MFLFDFGVAALVILVGAIAMYLLFASIDSTSDKMTAPAVVAAPVRKPHHSSSAAPAAPVAVKAQAQAQVQPSPKNKANAKKKALAAKKLEEEIDALIAADVKSAVTGNGGMNADAKKPVATTLEEVRKEKERVNAKTQSKMPKVKAQTEAEDIVSKEQGFIAVTAKKAKKTKKKIPVSQDNFDEDMDDKIRKFFRSAQGGGKGGQGSAFAKRDEKTGTALDEKVGLKGGATTRGWGQDE